MAPYTSAETTARRSKGEPDASSDGGTIRFFAAEMSDCTARGGNSLVEWPRWSIRRLIRLSRSSSS